MGSNGLDLKNAGIGVYAAGNWGTQIEKKPGLGQNATGTQALAANAVPRVQPVPPRGPQGPDPCPWRPRSNRRPAAGVVPAAAGSREGPRARPAPRCRPPRHSPFSFRPSAARRCRISRAPLRMARLPPPFLPWLAPGSAAPT